MATSKSTGGVKRKALALVDALPASANWSDVLYAIELGADIHQGICDANAGQREGTAKNAFAFFDPRVAMSARGKCLHHAL